MDDAGGSLSQIVDDLALHRMEVNGLTVGGANQTIVDPDDTLATLPMGRTHFNNTLHSHKFQGTLT